MPPLVDLYFQGLPHVIATAVLDGPDGPSLVDPGPTSCLARLEAGLQDLGLRLTDVRRLLLTHIHLDHAGASGTIVARVPGCRVAVHQRGARHLVDPSRLLASATRLYGEDMDRLWGAVHPIPADALQSLADGDVVDLGDRRLAVRETPGHASHHVAYFDPHDGTAYVGDTAGIHVTGDYLLPATPPPDIDIEAWLASLDVIEQLGAARLMLTHFGLVSDVTGHLRHFRAVLAEAAERVRATLDEPGSDEERMARHREALRIEVRRHMSEEDARSTELAAPFDQLWLGLARYWRTKP